MKENRIWEIDLLRVLALIMMIIFHTAYDLNYFAGAKINYENPMWTYIGKLSGLLFIFISGISSGFSKNSFKRGLKVFGYGMIITLATYVADKDNYIRFGILHLLGVSMMAFPLLKRLKAAFLIILSTVSIGIGVYIDGLLLNTKLLLPLGIMYPKFSSIDYYPIFPYIGIFIIGIFIYKKVYFDKRSIYKFNSTIPLVSIISKNSLKIYLLHQPIIIGVIMIIKKL